MDSKNYGDQYVISSSECGKDVNGRPIKMLSGVQTDLNVWIGNKFETRSGTTIIVPLFKNIAYSGKDALWFVVTDGKFKGYRGLILEVSNPPEIKIKKG